MAVVKNALLPLPVITSAMEGNNDALITVRDYYIGFIRALSTCRIKDADGNDQYYVDEEMQLRLENKLLWSIITGFRILPDRCSSPFP